MAMQHLKPKYTQVLLNPVDKWQIVGILLILVGITMLALLAGFIFTILVTLLKLIGVFAGIIMIVGGVILITGRHWIRRRTWWGGPASST